MPYVPHRENWPVLLLLVGTLSLASDQQLESQRPSGFDADDLIPRVEATRDGLTLELGRHRLDFTPEGIRVRSDDPELRWHWSLVEIGGERISSELVAPRLTSPSRIEYERGNVVEIYVLSPRSVEQQFLIKERGGQGDGPFVLRGQLSSNGRFEPKRGRWEWRWSTSTVWMGDVRVADAMGRALPASMAVSVDGTTISIDANHLAGAAYPVLIDPEIGANDSRISDMGPDGHEFYDAFEHEVVYNSVRNEYFVVWEGDDDSDFGEGSLREDEIEIWGQRIDATTGQEVGSDIRISDMGPDGHRGYDAFEPQVAFNPVRNEYFVVWRGDDDSDFGEGPLANGEVEVWGQRVSGATGLEIGSDIRISDMGRDGDASIDVHEWDDTPVVFNPIQSEYFVVWSAEEENDDGSDEETAIWGQRIDAGTGEEVGSNDMRISGFFAEGIARSENPQLLFNERQNEYFVVWQGYVNLSDREILGQRIDGSTGEAIGPYLRISDMGPDANNSYLAINPRAVYSPERNEYFVVWEGKDDRDFGDGPLGTNEFEIWGQRIDAAVGAQIGANDIRISDLGPDGSGFYWATDPEVAYNSAQQEYFVVWSGPDDRDFGEGPLSRREDEIWGQRIDAVLGSEIGVNDQRLSDMGQDGADQFDADEPRVVYNAKHGEYLVSWSGSDDRDFGNGPLVVGEREIWAQRVDALTGAEIGRNDLRLSDMGPDGSRFYGAGRVRLVFSPRNSEYYAVWSGTDDTDFGDGALAIREVEVWGQRLAIHVDAGDAPDSYGTLLAGGGPFHELDSDHQLFLGSCVDADLEGQAAGVGATADGDDLNQAGEPRLVIGTCDGEDDEDGVNFVQALIECEASSFEVFAGGVGGRLDGWIDYNRDGDFTDPGEEILVGLEIQGSQEPQEVTIDVPCGAAGQTYARFRLSSSGGLAPTGRAPNGEVEDYQITVQQQMADLSILKVASDSLVVPGQSIFFTILVSNLGPHRADGVSVADSLPLGLALISADSCVEESHALLRCEVGQIDPGEQATIAFSARVDSAARGMIVNTASVSSLTIDPDTANNVDPAEIAIEPLAVEVPTAGRGAALLMIVAIATYALLRRPPRDVPRSP